MPNTVLITGCSSGIGRAAAELFAERGWNVSATMRDPAAWSGTSTDAMLLAQLDVADRGSIDAAVAATVARFGRIDCLVNNAGQAMLSVVESTPIDTARAIFDVNLFGPMQLMQAVLPLMRERGAGRIVNVASGSAITPDPFMSIYSASKSALESLTEGMRFELEPHGVTLRLVEPGHVPSTGLGKAVQVVSSDIPVPAAYRSAVERITGFFTAPPPADATTEREVAEAILHAATVEDSALRVVVGDDAHLAARMRRETSEIEYLRWASDRFPGMTR